MFHTIIRKIQIIFSFTFLLGSILFYFILDDFYVKETYKTIEKNVLLSESIQEYVSIYQKPIIYDLIDGGKLSKEYFAPSIMSATFTVAHINEIYLNSSLRKTLGIDDSKHKFVSDNPLNPVNKTTPFELKVLNKFRNSDITSYSKRITHNGKDTLFFAIPSRKNTKECLKCHSDPKHAPSDMVDMYGTKSGFWEKEGDTRGMTVIYTSVDNQNNMLLFYVSIEIMMFIIFSIIYGVLAYFVKKLSQKDTLILKQSKFAAMGEMIGMIAHQWRQPLTGMGMTTDNLLLDIELGDVDNIRSKESLETINKQIAYLSDTIDDFKNFFKPGIQAEKVDINLLLDESWLVIGSTLKKNAVVIENESTQNVSVMTRKNDLLQVILNLIKNAMDAYVENKIENRIIYISALQTESDVQITVRDQAGGITDEIIDKIFNPYFSTKDAKNGTGLGLYMSKMIVESALGGKLDVRSENSSTTFTIILNKENK